MGYLWSFYLENNRQCRKAAHEIPEKSVLSNKMLVFVTLGR